MQKAELQHAGGGVTACRSQGYCMQEAGLQHAGGGVTTAYLTYPSFLAFSYHLRLVNPALSVSGHTSFSLPLILFHRQGQIADKS